MREPAAKPAKETPAAPLPRPAMSTSVSFGMPPSMPAAVRSAAVSISEGSAQRASPSGSGASAARVRTDVMEAQPESMSATDATPMAGFLFSMAASSDMSFSPRRSMEEAFASPRKAEVKFPEHVIWPVTSTRVMASARSARSPISSAQGAAVP